MCCRVVCSVLVVRAVDATLLSLLLLLLVLLLWLCVESFELLCVLLRCVGCAGTLRVTALALLAHLSGAGEGDVLDMCGVGVEATWTASEAVATAWACGQRRVVSLDEERLNMSTQPDCDAASM